MSTRTTAWGSAPVAVVTPKVSEVEHFPLALALPAAMAFLLALVPVLGTGARVPFLVVLVPLLLWTAFTNTEKALYVYIAWCWMDGTIRGVFDHNSVSVVARDILLILVVLGWGLQRLRTRETDPLRVPPATLLIVLFVGNCLIQVLNPFSLGLVQSLAGLKVHLVPLALYFVSYDIFRRRAQVRSLFVFLTLATVVIAGVSVVQYVNGRDWTHAHFPGSAKAISQNFNPKDTELYKNKDTFFKPPGTTGFGGGTGGFVGLILPLAFALALLHKDLRLAFVWRTALGGILFCFVVAIFLNGVRSALLTSAACVTLCGFLCGGRLRVRALAAVAACLALGVLAFSYSRGVSGGGVQDRFNDTLADPIATLQGNRKTFFDEFTTLITRPPIGVGLGRTGGAAGHLGTKDDVGFTVFSESYFANMYFETGLLGMLLIIGITVLLGVKGYETLQRVRDPDDRLLASALLSTLAVLIACCLAQPALVALPGFVVFWMYGAILFRVYGANGKEEGIAYRSGRQ